MKLQLDHAAHWRYSLKFIYQWREIIFVGGGMREPECLTQHSDQHTGWTTGVRFLLGAGTLFLRHRVQTGSGAHSSSCAVSIGVFPPGVMRSGREVDHSPPSSAEVKNTWSYTFTPSYVSIVRCLVKYKIHFHDVKHRGNFIITYTFTFGGRIGLFLNDSCSENLATRKSYVAIRYS